MRHPHPLSWRRRSSRFARHGGGPTRRFRAEALERRVLLATVSGVVYDDQDGDGARDAAEPGLGGWTVYHDDDGDSVMDAGEARVTTPANGSYALSFPAGTGPGGSVPTPEWIREVPQAAWRQTQGPYLLTATLTQSFGNHHFGNTRLALVSGRKYNDLDLDGNQDANESGLQGWTIYADLDNDSVRDFLEPADTTNANGLYSIALEASATSYRIREVAQPGWGITDPSSGFHSTLLSAGETDVGRDFGNTSRGRINGMVFDDTNANGAFDVADLPLENWTVYVDLNNNNVFDAATEPSDTTNSAGNYSFILPASTTYTVREARQSGWRQTHPAGDEHGVTLAPGEVVSFRMFGNTRLGLITGQKVNDLDGDGVRDTSEPVLPDWEIYLDLDNDAVHDASEPLDTTDADGRYSFSVATTRGYVVREVSRPGFRTTAPTSGSHSVSWSSTGQTHAGLDFLNTQRALFTGVKFNDLDVDGMLDSAEPFLQGWTIYADLNNDSTLDTGEPSDVTDSNGAYSLNLAPSATSYVIREVPRAGWAQTAPAAGFFNVQLENGEAAGGIFGNTQHGIVRGEIWNDLNGNGSRQAGEPGLPGWVAYVDVNQDGNRDPEDPFALADEEGDYSIIVTNANGPKLVRQVIQSGWNVSYPSPDTVGWAMSVLPGDIKTASFGNTQLGLIRGERVLDADADGVHDAGETQFADGTIYADLNGNDALDPGEPRDFNNTREYHLFVDYQPSPRTYTVRQVARAGFRVTSPASGEHTATFNGPGQVRGGLDFLTTDRRVIAGVKYNDLDGDGTRDAGEPGLVNWTIYADLDGDNTLDTLEPRDVSGNDGSYELVLPPLPDANPADVTIREVSQAGWRMTEPAGTGEYVLSLANGGRQGSRDFGNTQLALITGTKVNDENADGVNNAPGEPGLPGWTIFIDLDNDNALDAAEPRSVTDAQGRYAIPVSGNPSATYTVREVLQNGWRATSPAAGERTVSVTFAAQVLSDINFLNTARVLISGVKFNDVDADGTRDAGEPGLAGWTTYHDANNNNALDDGETRDVTDAAGFYSLAPPAPATGPGSYTVREVLEPTWRLTTPNTPEGEYALSLANGALSPNNNFGNTRRVVVTGIKYEDLNGSGTRQAGEPGLAGWTIYLDANDNNAFDAGELNATTEFDGRYSLLLADPPPAGPIRIREVFLPGWITVAPAGATRTLTVSAGQVVQDADFANARVGTVSGRKTHDLDADGAADAGEPGLPNWPIYDDANNNGLFDTADAPTFGYGDHDPLPRPTVNDAAVYSRIDVDAPHPVVRDLDVELTITHLRVNDLTAFLVSPRGTRVELFSNVGGTTHQDITRLTLDDEAAQSVTEATPPFRVDTLRPEGLLSAFDGEEADGRWVLEVFDQGQPGGTLSTGNLTGWRLFISTTERGTLTAAGVSEGDYSLTLPPGTRTIREELTGDWVPTFPAAGSQTVNLASNGAVTNIVFRNARRGSIDGVKFDDTDGDGTRDAGEAALPGWTIYRDLDDDAAFDHERGTFNSTDTPKPIDDATLFFGVTVPTMTMSSVNVTGGNGPIVDLSVTVNLDHQRPTDLSLRLSGGGSFSGRSIMLVNTGTLLGSLGGTIFDDDAASPLADGTPPYTGSFRPAEPLSTFDGLNANGSWTLLITDNVREWSGELLGWSLDIARGEPFTVTDATGAYRFEDMLPGQTHVIREAPQAGWRQTTPAGDGAHRVRLNSDQETTGRDFGNLRTAPVITEVFARGSLWIGDDGNPATLSFKEYLEAKTVNDVPLGHRAYGYRLTEGQTVPWINVNELVLRYSGPTTTAAIPTPGTVVLDGVRQDYTVTAVTALDDRTVALTLDRPLGNIPGGGVDGDRVRLTVRGAGAGGADFARDLLVLQGDASRDALRRVNAADQGYVKARLNRTTNAPGTGLARYTVFADVNADGRVNAADQGAVKSRLNDGLPALPAAAANLQDVAGVTEDLFGSAAVL